MKISPSKGFSIFELLAVVAILALLVTLMAPVPGSVIRSFEISRAVETIYEYMGFARKASRIMGRPVELRLYLPNDPLESSNAADAVALFVRSSDGLTFEALRPRTPLPTGAVVHRNTTYSSLIAASSGPFEDQFAPYYAFRFLPDGTVELSSQSLPTLTIVSRRDLASVDLPGNFAVLQITPQVSGLRILRP